MKIIEKREAHKRMAYFGKCPYCESTLRVIEPEPNDPKEPGVEHHYDGAHNYTCFVCPVCGEGVTFNTSNKNVEYKCITLTPEDRAEIESWGQKSLH